MELAAKDVAAPGHAREAPDVVGAGRNLGRVRVVCHGVGVREVDVRALGHAGKQGAAPPLLRHVELVPTHVRDLEARGLEPGDGAGEHTEARRPGAAQRVRDVNGRCLAGGLNGCVGLGRHALDAALAQKLQAQADAEERHPAADGLEHRLVLATLAHELDRVIERADAGKHETGGGADDRRVVADHDIVPARAHDTAADARVVALVVVDDDNHTHQRLPFVDGTPMTRGSSSHAKRSARPKALNAASMM